MYNEKEKMMRNPRINMIEDYKFFNFCAEEFTVTVYLINFKNKENEPVCGFTFCDSLYLFCTRDNTAEEIYNYLNVLNKEQSTSIWKLRNMVSFGLSGHDNLTSALLDLIMKEIHEAGENESKS
jgi:hypothetical protein